MIIYCAGPIKGNTTYQENYFQLVQIVESLGHMALSEMSTKFHSSIPLNAKQIYARDLKWLDGSKLMIAEVSGPSLGVGFEVAYALFHKKIPVLAVHHEQSGQISSMISGCNDKKLVVKNYTDNEDLANIIKSFIIENGGN
ncbi:MAG: nucleoside 2-deoxyribosyltransferase [Ignavibacteriaceae bacterium]